MSKLAGVVNVTARFKLVLPMTTSVLHKLSVLKIVAVESRGQALRNTNVDNCVSRERKRQTSILCRPIIL